MKPSTPVPPSALSLLVLLSLLLPLAAAAHELPARVAMKAFVKPEGDTLRVLVRVPLDAMRDMTVPTRGPGYLNLDAAGPVIRDAAALWLGDDMRFYEDGRDLGTPRIAAARVSLPSSTAFDDGYASALDHVTGPPLPADTELYWQQGLLDVLLEYAIRRAEADFAVDLGFAHLGLRTVTVLHFLPPGGAERTFSYEGDQGRVVLDPAWYQAAGQFVAMGFDHVLAGIDHLLFVFCLVLPFRRWKPLVMLVTAFTVAHSITLAAAALGMAPRGGWFAPLVETLIAASIVYLALENLLAVVSGRTPRLDRRWLAAFGFGLVHGFGFAFVLGDRLQFAGAHLVTALAAFNVGIELGQLLVVAVSLGALALLQRLGAPERFVLVAAGVAVTHTAWHWMLERGGELAARPWSWPSMDAAWWAAAMRWTVLALIAVAVLWLLHLAYRRWGAEASAGEL